MLYAAQRLYQKEKNIRVSENSRYISWTWFVAYVVLVFSSVVAALPSVVPSVVAALPSVVAALPSVVEFVVVVVLFF
jgi:hypothetical protein